MSFDQPETTAQITGLGALRLLEAVRMVNPRIRYYQASTSEMFGKVQEIPQKETTLSTPVVRMAWPSFMLIGSHSTTVKATTSSDAAGFSSTMNPPCAGSSL